MSHPVRRVFRDHPLATFLPLAFALSWYPWLIALAPYSDETKSTSDNCTNESSSNKTALKCATSPSRWIV